MSLSPGAIAEPAILDVALLPSMVTPESLSGQTVVVVDVLRATTTIAVAIANGCRQVLPQPSVEAARARYQQLEDDVSTRGQALIGGERGGRIVDGFQQGNSPLEYTPDVIRDRILILATTNGTVAMERCRQAERVLTGSMVNLTAVAQEVLHDPRVTVLCSGTDRHLTGEDVLFAGALVDRIETLRQAQSLASQRTDTATLAHHHWLQIRQEMQAGRPLADFFRHCRGGINLSRIGHDPDIEFAAEIDRVPVLPELNLSTWQIESASTLSPLPSDHGYSELP